MKSFIRLLYDKNNNNNNKNNHFMALDRQYLGEPVPE